MIHENETEKKLRAKIHQAVKGIYYSDIDIKIPWEPFQDYEDAFICECIDNDTNYWYEFITTL